MYISNIGWISLVAGAWTVLNASVSGGSAPGLGEETRISPHGPIALRGERGIEITVAITSDVIGPAADAHADGLEKRLAPQLLESML